MYRTDEVVVSKGRCNYATTPWSPALRKWKERLSPRNRLDAGINENTTQHEYLPRDPSLLNLSRLPALLHASHHTSTVHHPSPVASDILDTQAAFPKLLTKTLD
jgi:hypothetical protein